MNKCTIIVPVYNCQPHLLRRCLDCFCSTDSETEILVIDDGSTNDIAKILTEYPVRVITQSNRGVSSARNVGIAKATGKYVVFCDADDIVDLNALKSAIHYAEENTADYVMTPYHKISNTRDTIISVFETDSAEGYLKQMLCEPNCYGTVWAKVMRREFLLNNGIMFNQELTHGEDSIFIIDCLKNSPNVAVYFKPFYSYYVYTSSAAKINRNALENYINMMSVGKSHLEGCIAEYNPYYSCFCCINALIMMVNYIFPKGSNYSDGKVALTRVLNTTIVAESLTSYPRNCVSLTNRIAFFFLRNKCYIMCYIMTKIKNRNK